MVTVITIIVYLTLFKSFILTVFGKSDSWALRGSLNREWQSYKDEEENAYKRRRIANQENTIAEEKETLRNEIE